MSVIVSFIMTRIKIKPSKNELKMFYPDTKAFPFPTIYPSKPCLTYFMHSPLALYFSSHYFLNWSIYWQPSHCNRLGNKNYMELTNSK